MNQPTPAATASRSNPKAVGESLLKLLSSLQSAADLTAEQVERETGWTMQSSDHGTGYRAGAALTPDWGYSLSLSTPSGSDRKQLRFEFNRKNPDATATAICDPDLERYAQVLQSLGYQRSALNAEHDRSLGWSFQRQGLWVRIYTRSESEDAFEHECVSLITVE